MEEILMELKILKKVLEDSSKSLKFRLDNDNDFEKDTSFLEENISFGRLLYSITKDLTNNDLLTLSDDELVKHIQKIQIIEKEQ